MKAVVAHGAHDLRLEDRPVPRAGAGEVLVRMTHGGICGSDLHYHLDGRVGTFEIREPLVLGHEVVGVVAGNAVAGGAGGAVDEGGALAPGTPVAVHPASPCGACDECTGGRPNICRNARYLGSAASSPHTQGAFSENAVFRADQLRPLPANLPLDRAVLAEPLGVALHAISRAGSVRDRSVLVSGSGPIGLLVIAAAVVLGAREVAATDVLEHPLTVASALGATRVFRLGVDEVPAQHFDVTFEAAGVPAALTTAIRATRRAGTVVQVGMLPSTPEPVALAELVSRELELRGAFRFDDEIDAAIRMLAEHPLFDAIVTHTFDLADVEEAFGVAADASRSSKVVLRLGEAPGGN